MRLHTHVQNALQAAGRSTSQEFTRRLQRDAVEAGWSKEAARSIRVSHHDAHLSVTHDGDDFEFGTQDRPPIAVTREFTHQIEAADTHFANAVYDALEGLL